jgi:hypothetical protein
MVYNMTSFAAKKIDASTLHDRLGAEDGACPSLPGGCPSA